MNSPDGSSQVPADLQHLHEQLQDDPGNPGLHAKYYWSLHQYMKAKMEEGSYDNAVTTLIEMGRYQVASEKAANATGWAVHKVLKVMKEDQRKLQLDEETVLALVQAYLAALPHSPSPDKMHSAMIWVTTQLQSEEPASWYIPMVRAVGFERLQPEDFQGKEVNGYPLPSLAERVVMTAAKRVEHTPEQDEIDWLLPQINRLLEAKPQNVWLKFHKAKVLIAMGRRDEVRDYVRPIVTSKRTEFWAWAVLGETYAVDEPAKALSCLCKAITLKEDEIFLLGVRELLAQVLLALGRMAEAKTEIEKVLTTRRNRNCKIPARITAIVEQPWYAGCTPADNSMLYIGEARSADDLLFEDAVGYVGVVTNIDEKSRSCFVTFRLDASARYRYHRTPWEKNLPAPGTFVALRVREVHAEGSKRFEAVSMQPASQVPDPSFAREFHGAVKVIAKPGKDPIGFVVDVFVPSTLLKACSLANGDEARGVAVKEMNRAKGEYGWRAVKVEAVPKAVEAPLPVPEPVPQQEMAPSLAGNEAMPGALQVEPGVAEDVLAAREKTSPNGDLLEDLGGEG